MSYYQCFKVFIASPGDVKKERHFAEEVIRSVNNTLRDTLGIMVDLVKPQFSGVTITQLVQLTGLA